MLFGPTNEEMITEIFRAERALLQGPAAQPLPHPVEVPRRGAAALRRHALARVPDEGRLFLRPRRRGRAPQLHEDVRRLPAHLRALRPDRDPDGRRHRPDRRRPQPRVHHPGLDRRERGVLPPRLPRLHRAAGDIDFDDRAAMQGVFDKWTSLYAATSEKHDAAAFAALPEASRISARGIEVGHIFYFGTKYSKPMKAVVNGPDGREHFGPFRLLRHRPEPARRGADRGQSRRGRHDLAGRGGAVRRRRRST